MRKRKVLMTVGIRPDGNKISPLYKKFTENNDFFETVLVNTGQHSELLSEMLKIFKIKENYNLKTMNHGQSLADQTIKMVKKLDKVLEIEKPDIIFSPNDSTTSFITALCAFYRKIPLAHVEAGLRTNDLKNPFPEEGNRKMIGVLTNYHFAPTQIAKENLLEEKVDPKSIFVTGNTLIDSLQWAVKNSQKKFEEDILNSLDFSNNKVIVVTTHRRENWGDPMREALSAIRKLVIDNKDVIVIFPVHPSHVVKQITNDVLGSVKRIHLINPLSYLSFIKLLSKSYLILSDSGGIQEEAPTFGKPLLVMRETTERPEGIKAGGAKLVGTDKEKIYSEALNLISNEKAYLKMSKAINPYGDGKACDRILQITKCIFKLEKSLPKEFNPNGQEKS